MLWMLQGSDQASFGLPARFSTRATFGLAVQTDYLTEGEGRRGREGRIFVSSEKAAADKEHNKIPWLEKAADKRLSHRSCVPGITAADLDGAPG